MLNGVDGMRYIFTVFFFLLHPSLALSELAPEYDLGELLLPVGEGGDISKLYNAMPTPGEHSLLVKLNGRKIHNDEYRFISNGGQSQLCVSVDNMVKLGVNTDKLESGSFDMGCFNSVGGDVFFQFHPDSYSIDFFVTTSFLLSEYEKNIKNVDNGISSVRINYSYLDYSYLDDIVSHGRLRLDSMATLGAWRFAGNSYLKRNAYGGGSFEQQQAYAYRHIAYLGSYFSFGKFVSKSSPFGNVMFTGVEYATDNRLREKPGIKTSLTSYYAKKDALLTLKQDGVVLDEMRIYQGFFELPVRKARSSSDLEVNLDYGNNQVEVFFVPVYEYVNNLRRGEYDFSFNAGEISNLKGNPFFIGGNLSYGLYNNLTLNGGARLGEEKNALSFSADYASTLGRLSAGGIYDSPTKGADNVAHFFKYSKSFDSLFFFSANTTFNNRINEGNGKSGHYDSQSVFLSSQYSLWNTTAGASFEHRNYDSGKKQSSLALSAASRHVDFSHTLNYRLSNDLQGRSEHYFGMSISVPFSINQYSIRLNRVHSSNEKAVTSLDVAGELSDDVNVSAGVSTHDSGDFDSGNIAINHRSSFSDASLSYVSNKNADYLSLGLSGQVAYTEHGFVSSGDTSKTSFLVHVPDVEGIEFYGARGVKTNANGYALVKATPFDKTYLHVNKKSILDDVDIINTTISGVASEGALIYKKIDATKGKPYLIKVTNNDSLNIPFGAEVFIDGMETNNIASSGGDVFISSLPVAANKVSVLWAGGQCDISLQSFDSEEKNDITILRSRCIKSEGGHFAISKNKPQY